MLRRLLIACAAATLMAQAPVIRFDKSLHDFGRTTPDRKVAVKYRVTNTGDANLNITQVRPSCGCTFTLLGEWSLAPGESTEIKTLFDPKGLRGRVRKSIEVICNDPKAPISSLILEGEVVQEIIPSVEAVYMLQAPRSATSRKQIRYASGTGEAVQLLEVQLPDAPHLSFTHGSEGKDLILEILLDGNKVPLNRNRGMETAAVRFANQRVNQLPLSIFWDLKTAIQASPAELSFFDVPGKELRQKLSLRQVEGRAFRVRGASPSLLGLRLEGLNQKAAVQDLVVVLPATLTAGRYTEIVTLATDDPEQPELQIRVMAVLK